MELPGEAGPDTGRQAPDREHAAAQARAAARRKYGQLPPPVSAEELVTTHDEAPPPEPGFDANIAGALRWAGLGF